MIILLLKISLGILVQIFLNLVRFKYEVANGNFNGAINILNKNGLNDYYDNNIVLSDVYKAFISSGKVSNALTFLVK